MHFGKVSLWTKPFKVILVEQTYIVLDPFLSWPEELFVLRLDFFVGA